MYSSVSYFANLINRYLDIIQRKMAVLFIHTKYLSINQWIFNINYQPIHLKVLLCWPKSGADPSQFIKCLLVIYKRHTHAYTLITILIEGTFPWLLRIVQYNIIMMTSSIGNIFRVVGPLCCPLWIPPTEAGDAELWCVLWPAPEQTVDQTIEAPVIWDTIALIMTSL